MKLEEAIELLRGAVAEPGGTWADLGAGAGTFTRALARLLGPDARIVAVDRDARAVRSLGAQAADQDDAEAAILPVEADFRDPRSVPELAAGDLDGVLLANSLHYVAEADRVLLRFRRLVRAGGRVVVVEYEGRRASPWVPHPVSLARLRTLATEAGLSIPVVVGERASAYGGMMYCAFCTRDP